MATRVPSSTSSRDRVIEHRRTRPPAQALARLLPRQTRLQRVGAVEGRDGVDQGAVVSRAAGPAATGADRRPATASPAAVRDVRSERFRGRRRQAGSRDHLRARDALPARLLDHDPHGRGRVRGGGKALAARAPRGRPQPAPRRPRVEHGAPGDGQRWRIGPQHEPVAPRDGGRALQMEPGICAGARFEERPGTRSRNSPPATARASQPVAPPRRPARSGRQGPPAP